MRIDKFGRHIDRTKKIAFTFDGKKYSGYKGDTLASALLANGVHLFGRSFKYHRPRGLLCENSAEPNALITINGEPNMRASMVEIYEGLQAHSQNRFPSLEFDLQSITQIFSKFLVAGFYYKTFMWPASFWEPIYEKLIRRAAGLGRASQQSDKNQYEHAHAHCDVLIVGGGVAGIASALDAAKTAARIILVDERNAFGGNCCATEMIENKPAPQWCNEKIDELKKMKNVKLMQRTTLFGHYDGNLGGALQRITPPRDVAARLWTIRAKQIIFACGAQELPLVFTNNDLPNIMLASTIRLLVEKYAVLAGKKIILATNNDEAYKTAEILLQANVKPIAIIDSRKVQSSYAKKIAEQGVKIFSNATPLAAHGKLQVHELSIQTGDGIKKIKCDCVGFSNGLAPDVHLASQMGAAPIWSEKIQAFLPPPSKMHGAKSVGACNGDFNIFLEPTTAQINSKAFVDFQNDVSSFDITLANQEGFRSIEHVKRYTTLGMATEQGKTANINALKILAAAQNKPIAEIGTTRFRPPYSPVPIGAFAGRERGKHYMPTRKTALHSCNEKLGSTFIESGQWLRPQFFAQQNENVMQTIFRETKCVRETAGICDVSTLGKIELFGEDAANFLDILYVNNWQKLAVGKARYGVMLREDGFVFDDGTTSRLGENHFLITTTTANAATVLAHMEKIHQVHFPELDVHFCSATEQWCGVAVAGPNSRKILQQTFGQCIDLSNESFPFMSAKCFDWNGVAARIFRISFSGELAYEVNVSWHDGKTMWEKIFQVGKTFGLIPYGLEALSALRIEKGHVAGPELDGRTTLDDLGLGKMMANKTCIGKVMAGRAGMVDKARAKLIGIKLQGAGRLRAGAHLFADKNKISSTTDLGWVSSVCHSPQLNCWIGLAFIAGGLEKFGGQKLFAASPLHKETASVEICSPHFFDPQGERLHG